MRISRVLPLRTIRARILVIVIGCMSLGFAVSYGFTTVRVYQVIEARETNLQLERTRILSNQVRDDVLRRKSETIPDVLSPYLRNPEFEIQGIRIWASGNEELYRFDAPEIQSSLDGSYLDSLRSPLDIGEGLNRIAFGYHISVVPVFSKNYGEPIGRMVVVWSTKKLTERFQEIFIFGIAIALLLIGALIGLMLVCINRTISTPLSRLTETMIEVSKGDKTISVPYADRTDNIGDIARTVKRFQLSVELIDRITREHREQAQRLSDALDKEKEYNALQRQFVEMASHEFRTPLAIIDGTSQRIERRADKMDTEEILGRVRKIRDAVQRMMVLIESTLSAARLEAGSIEVSPEEIDLKDLLQRLCEQQRGISKGHEINADFEKLPQSIYADPARVEQIFANLLSNAVKYSPDNPVINIYGEVIGNDAVVMVQDHGLGIPKQDIPKMFERFFRASTSSGIAGTGIGLNLVKQLVKLHGGRVELYSVEGEGSIFTVYLPVAGPVVDSEPEAHGEDNYEDPFAVVRGMAM